MMNPSALTASSDPSIFGHVDFFPSKLLRDPPTPEIKSVVHFTLPYRRSHESNPCEAAVINFQTTVTIPDYYKYYGHSPSDAFAVPYVALRDGSLIAPPLLREFPFAFANLVLSGIFLLIAVRNAIVSASFIWRIKIKKKGLFYALFSSQFLGLLMLCVKQYSTFRSETSCVM